jgi:hypothetical protein
MARKLNIPVEMVSATFTKFVPTNAAACEVVPDPGV